MQITVHEFISLDGVVQGPGAPDEDRDGGFAHGGWLMPFVDEGFGAVVDGWFQRTTALLYGRRTYEMMAAHWPHVTDPGDAVAAKLNAAPKHLVSTTLTDPGWGPVTVHDSVDAVRELKASGGDGELQVHGCAQLARALHEAGLVDEYRLLQAPVTLGAGKRLFAEDAPATGMAVVDSRVTDAGLVYRALRPAALATGTAVIEDGRSAVELG